MTKGKSHRYFRLLNVIYVLYVLNSIYNVIIGEKHYIVIIIAVLSAIPLDIVVGVIRYIVTGDFNLWIWNQIIKLSKKCWGEKTSKPWEKASIRELIGNMFVWAVIFSIGILLIYLALHALLRLKDIILK